MQNTDAVYEIVAVAGESSEVSLSDGVVLVARLPHIFLRRDDRRTQIDTFDSGGFPRGDMDEKTGVAASEFEDGFVVHIAFPQRSKPFLNLRATINRAARQIVPRGGKGLRRLRVAAAHAAIDTRDESFVRRQRLST